MDKELLLVPHLHHPFWQQQIARLQREAVATRPDVPLLAWELLAAPRGVRMRRDDKASRERFEAFGEWLVAEGLAVEECCTVDEVDPIVTYGDLEAEKRREAEERAGGRPV